MRFSDNERRETTLRLLAECFEVLRGVPKVVLADRMGCLKATVVANLVVPVPDYVRLATHYRFRPDFYEAADPGSKGLVEHLVAYAKSDLVIPDDLSVARAPPTGPPMHGAQRSNGAFPRSRTRPRPT